MKINCIIIEDEPLAADKLKGFIEKIPILNFQSWFDNALDAMAYLKENTIDLVFLDIQMKSFSGIQFLESIIHKPHVIITSAFDQYALKCYEFSIDDYLLKPYSFERFVQAIEKIFDKKSKETSNKTEHKDFIFIHTEYRMEKVNLEEILHIEGMKDYLKIITSKKNILTLQNFKKILEILPTQLFIRTHKSYIVSIKKIESIERNRIKIGNALIPISDTYKEDFYKLIDQINKQ